MFSRKLRSLLAMSIESLYKETRTALAHGKSTKLAVDALVEGLSEPIADTMGKRAALRRSGWLAVAKGASFVAIGIAVTAGTYTMGLPLFLIGWGPVIFGGITMFKGLSRAMLG
jgi:hypothetical protein